jgi:hypothetical protein
LGSFSTGAVGTDFRLISGVLKTRRESKVLVPVPNDREVPEGDVACAPMFATIGPEGGTQSPR